jgi:NADH:ubiquinone oxidoreductase subunit 3 (subunit A)
MEYFYILLFFILTVVFVAGGLIIVHLLAPNNPGGVKGLPYECGVETFGPAWVQYNVGYYLFGLLFLAFDVEAAFLYPWAVAFRQVGAMALVEAGIFVAVLILGLAYAWKKGALEWV